jgi:hypothetical protein
MRRQGCHHSKATQERRPVLTDKSRHRQNSPGGKPLLLVRHKRTPATHCTVASRSRSHNTPAPERLRSQETIPHTHSSRRKSSDAPCLGHVTLGVSAIRNRPVPERGTIASPTGPSSHERGTTASPTGTSPHQRGTTPSPTGASSHERGTTASPTGASPHQRGMTPSPTGTAFHQRGTTASPTGASSHQRGTTPSPTGASSHQRGTTASPTGV